MQPFLFVRIRKLVAMLFFSGLGLAICLEHISAKGLR